MSNKNSYKSKDDVKDILILCHIFMAFEKCVNQQATTMETQNISLSQQSLLRAIWILRLK